MRRRGAGLASRATVAAHLAATAGLLAAAGPAAALINLNYTPVDLVRQSEVILRLEIGRTDAAGKLAVRGVQAVQGPAPPRLELVLDATLQAEGKEHPERLPWREGGHVAAMLFSGDFSGAAGGDQAGDDGKPAGVLHVDIPVSADETHWFGLFARPDGSFRIAADPLAMKTVWAGGHEMLRRAVAHIQGDARADVPVAVGVQWAADEKLGKVEGAAHGAIAADLDGSGRDCLLVLAEGGDRLFAPASDAGRLQDATERLRLATKSRAAAWGDFDGDGRLDLASWDGRTLTLALRRADGSFQSRSGGVQWPGGCLSLAPIDAGGGPRAGLLAGTAGTPILLAPGRDGGLAAQPLAKYEGEPLGQAGPCALADFDGDGLPDVLQLHAKGALLYKGKGGGAFDPPLPAVRIGPGGRPGAPVVGDFDADGLPDCLVTGGGICLLRNLGGGRFAGVLEEAGEVAYTSQRSADGAAAMDINHDGRLDLLLTRARADLLPLFYFNRGFACLGAAVALELEQSDLPCRHAARKGQQAAAAADLDGDGATDVALVTADGEVWALYRGAAGNALGLTVRLPPAAAGPVNVVADDGKRCLGARVLRPGGAALFGKVGKGPLDLRWRLPGGAEQTTRVVVLKPTRIVLGADGK